MPRVRLGAYDLRADGTGSGGMEPFGVLLEEPNGLGLATKYLPEVVNGDVSVRGWKQYISRFSAEGGITNLSNFWENVGPILDFARTENMSGRFPVAPLLTPREWITRQSSWNLPGGSWLSLFVTDAASSVDDLYTQYVIEREVLPADHAFFEEIPTYSRLGDRFYREGELVTAGTRQALATLKMMMAGVCGYVWSFDDPLAARDLRVLESPEADILESWRREDRYRRYEREQVADFISNG